ncbi:unnamed protein product [Ectocarpus fasciculatus]
MCEQVSPCEMKEKEATGNKTTLFYVFGYMYKLVDSGTTLSVVEAQTYISANTHIYRTYTTLDDTPSVDIGLRDRGRRYRTVVDEDDNFMCYCGWECEDRVHVVAECSLYKKEREAYMAELGKIEGRYREMFEAWNRKDKTVTVLGHSKWVE